MTIVFTYITVETMAVDDHPPQSTVDCYKVIRMCAEYILLKGTSNIGNVGRISLTNYHESSKITGVDEDLIRRFGVIMIALSSGYQIHI